MTIDVAFDGVVLDTADVAANWTAIKITSGGQAPTAVAADAAYEGLNNVTCRSDNKRVYMYTDSGTTYDFTIDSSGAGTVKVPGAMFYIWVNFLPSPLLNTQAGGGLGIVMSSVAPTATQYSLWYFHGRDTYTGGWIRLAIDPNKTRSDGGTQAFDAGNVRYFGAFAHNNQGAAKYDNFVVDQCAIGKGLIVTGTSTLGLGAELLADEEANRHGVVTGLNEAGTALEILGTITLGDSSGILATDIVDEDSKLFVSEPLYYETTLKASVPIDFLNLKVVGNATGATDVKVGQEVGTTNGRNGLSIVGNSTYNFGFDRDDGAVESSDFLGCSFENITGTISLDGTHNFNGSTLVGCSGANVDSNVQNLTVVSSGTLAVASGINIEDSLFIEATATAVTTDNLTRISGSSFTSSGTNHAVDLGTNITTQSMIWDNQDTGYTAASFGNETIVASVADGNTLTINVAEGASTPSVFNQSLGSGVILVVSGSVTIDVNVKDQSENPVSGALVYIDEDLGVVGSIANTTTDAAGDIAQASYSGAVEQAIVRVRLYGYKPSYSTISLLQNTSLNVTLISDPQQT